jgi:hypothetical protein
LDIAPDESSVTPPRAAMSSDQNLWMALGGVTLAGPRELIHGL